MVYIVMNGEGREYVDVKTRESGSRWETLIKEGRAPKTLLTVSKKYDQFISVNDSHANSNYTQQVTS